MIRKKIFFIISFFLVLISLSSCNTKQENNDIVKGSNDVSFTDSLNNYQTIEYNITDVIIGYSSYLQVYQYVTDIPVLATVKDSFERTDLEPLDTNITANLGSYSAIDLEQVIKFKPKLVILNSNIQSQVDLGEKLKNLDVDVCYFSLESFDDYLFLLKCFSYIYQKDNLYKEYGLDVLDQINEIISKSKEKNTTYKYLVIQVQSTGKMKVKGNTTHFLCDMLNDLGMLNVASGTNTEITEEIIKEQPDFVFVTCMGDEKKAYEAFDLNITNNMGNITELNAIKNKKYYTLEKSLFQYKPNKNWAKAYQIIFDDLYGI